MTEILDSIINQNFKYIVAIVAIILGFIEKSGIKWNPYSQLLKLIGRGINSDLLKKIEIVENNLSSFKTEIDELKKDMKETAIINCRTQFTRFGDEIRHGEEHSKDHYDQTMLNITKYELYCQAHPDFANDVTEATAKLIKRDYQKRLENNDFLE